MAHGRWMRRYARWHIWLGWLVGVPLVLWTLSGVAMVVRPIEEVRGEHLRIEREAQPIPAGAGVMREFGLSGEVTEVTARMDGETLVALATFADGHKERRALNGRPLPAIDAAAARAIVAREIRGGDRVARVEFFDAPASPLDFRKTVPAWRVTLDDGTYVYVGSESARIEAVRTRWWRMYDFLWGIHIMDLQTREDAHNPVTIVFGSLAFVGALLGFTLLFRRRKARGTA